MYYLALLAQLCISYRNHIPKVFDNRRVALSACGLSMDRSQRGEMAIPNSASAKHISSHDHLVFKDTQGFPFREQYPAARNATCSFCCTEQQAAATPIFILYDLATEANELERADHGGYILVARRHPTVLHAHSTYTMVKSLLRCHRQRLLQRPPLPPKPLSSTSLESVGRVATANS